MNNYDLDFERMEKDINDKARSQSWQCREKISEIQSKNNLMNRVLYKNHKDYLATMVALKYVLKAQSKMSTIIASSDIMYHLDETGKILVETLKATSNLNCDMVNAIMENNIEISTIGKRDNENGN